MRNWKISPKNSTVAKYIDCYWFIEMSPCDSGPEFPKLNPDPAGHLLLSKPEQPYQYDNESRSASGCGSHLLLPHCKTLSMDHSQPFTVLGAKFQVGALYSLKFPTAHPLLDQVINVEAEKLFQLGRFNTEEILTQGAMQPDMCRDVLDKLLSPFLSVICEDRHSTLVRKALAAFSEVLLSEMGDELGCSQRTMERSFLRVTGLTLKQYSSIERLEQILNYVHKLDSKEIAWADIAFQFGFSDQPHLVRYLKNSIGHTPGKYTRQRDLAIDVYGDFD
jgi:AraC-like DNA-binding protein